MHTRTTRRRRIMSTIAVAALFGSGALGGTAHAWTDHSRPDLVGAGPTEVVVLSTGTAVFGHVRNDVTGWTAFAQASNATINFQPLSRVMLQGEAHYINRPWSTAFTAAGRVARLAPGGDDRFSARLDRIPWGHHRVTVCADSSGAVFERSELNNCSSEIKDVVPFVVGD